MEDYTKYEGLKTKTCKKLNKVTIGKYKNSRKLTEPSGVFISESGYPVSFFVTLSCISMENSFFSSVIVRSIGK